MKKAVSGAKNSAGLVRSRAKPPPPGIEIAAALVGHPLVVLAVTIAVSSPSPEGIEIVNPSSPAHRGLV